MDGPAAKPESRWKLLGVRVLYLVLTFVAILMCLYGAVLIDTPPQVGARPGVRSMVGPDGHTRVTDCGGTSLHIIRHGAQVGAELTERARAAEAACRRGAWNSVVVGVVLFLLIPPSVYSLLKLHPRADIGPEI
jgi:hypothetical protein